MEHMIRLYLMAILCVLPSCLQKNLFKGTPTDTERAEDALSNNTEQAISLLQDLNKQNPADGNIANLYAKTLLTQHQLDLNQKILDDIKEIQGLDNFELSLPEIIKDLVDFNQENFEALNESILVLERIQPRTYEQDMTLASAYTTLTLMRIEILSHENNVLSLDKAYKASQDELDAIISSLDNATALYQKHNDTIREEASKKLRDKITDDSGKITADSFVNWLKLGDFKEGAATITAKDTNLIILGDSIAVGIFSDTTIGTPLSADRSESITNAFLKTLFAGGESAQNDINAIFKHGLDEIYLQEGHSAYSSAADFSIATQLGLTDAVVNLAVSGSQITDIMAQVNRLPDTFDDKTNTVIINVGSNDLCNTELNTNFNDAFKAEYEAVLNELNRRFTGTVKILLVSAFDITKLAVPAFEDQAFSAGELSTFYSMTTCKEMQAKLCSTLSKLQANTFTKDDITTNHTNLNLTIQDLATSNATAHYVETKSMTDNIEAEDLALDGFHPSQIGQEKVAALVKAVYDTIP